MVQVSRQRTVMIAAGGTGGHVFPGIAIAEEVRAADPSVRILFVGTERGLESKLVPLHGWPLILLKAHSVKDRLGWRRCLALMRIPLSILRAFMLLMRRRPSVLVGIGGYAAGPLCIAAWILRIPIVLVEPNAIAGLTNRLLGRFARRIFVAFDAAAAAFSAKKVVLTGVPVRREIVEIQARRAAKDNGRMTIFIFGGSQGARTLNRAAVGALESLQDYRSELRFLHQTGEGEESDLVAPAYRKKGYEAQVFSFTERIWECYQEADLVIARSGANTVAELSALGIVSILVPYPFAADDHQRANAEELVRAGGARMLLDHECTGKRLAHEISALLSDRARLEEMQIHAQQRAKPDAASSIAQACLALMHEARAIKTPCCFN